MIQLALIGVGTWGKNYISTLNSFKDCKIKYICAKSPKTLQHISDNYIKTTNYKDLFSYNDIDGVIIATPISTHYQIASEFLFNGFNVLIEKPAVASYKEVERLKKVWDAKKSIFMTDYVYLYNPAFHEFKRQIDTIGDIQYLDSEGSNWGPFREGTSALWDWAPHDISMYIALLGTPLSVQSWAVTLREQDKPTMNDMVYCKLRFEKNVIAFMKIGTLSPKKVRRLTVVGSKRSIIFNELDNNKLRVFATSKPEKNNKNSEIKYPSYPKDKPLELVIKEFISCIKSKKQPKFDMNFTVQVTKVIDAVEQSVLHNSDEVTIPRTDTIQSKK